jgi:dihydrofolate reductase
LKVVLIAAVASNGVIGIHGRLPWRLPADMARFRARTYGHHVVMGRRTFESLGKPLPGRTNLVVTRNPRWTAPGVRAVASLEEALRVATTAGDTETFVIGGAELYAAALPVAVELDLTEVEASPEGDVRFPPWVSDEWREVSREAHGPDASHPWAYSFVVRERRPPV